MTAHVEWIDGDPPPSRKAAPRQRSAATTLAIGQLMTRPGQWAIIQRGPVGSSGATLRQHDCEYVQRTLGGTILTYARYVGPPSGGITIVPPDPDNPALDKFRQISDQVERRRSDPTGPNNPRRDHTHVVAENFCNECG